MWRWENTRGKTPSVGRLTGHTGSRRVAGLLTIVTLFGGLLSFSFPAPNEAHASSIDSCRAGQVVATKLTNGKHAPAGVGLTIEPVFANGIYADLSAGYDAAYVAYQIESTSDRSNVWVTLDDWMNEDNPSTPPVVTVSRSREGEQFIGSLSANVPKTVYFLLRATGYTTDKQSHVVNVWERGYRNTFITKCKTNIEGVKRSISARANKVTSIATSIDPDLPPALGDTFTITVKGATGNVGSGSSAPDFSVMTLSPTSYSQWPSASLRLEDVNTRLVTRANFVNNDNNRNTRCPGWSTVTELGGTGQDKNAEVEFRNRLVLRNFSQCSVVKSTYTTVYTFRVINSLTSNPTIRPVSDISSGTQIKYTGGYPSETTSVSSVGTTVPPNVSSARVTKSGEIVTGGDSGLPLIDTEANRFFVDYTVTASTTGDPVTLDSIVDSTPPGSSLVGNVNNNEVEFTSVRQVVSSSGSLTELTFGGPFSVGAGNDQVFTYRLSLPLPEDDTDYINSAFGLFGSYSVGSGDNKVSGVEVTVDVEDDGITISAQTISLGLLQEIQFVLPPEIGADASINLTGYADSGLGVEYISSTTDVCIVRNIGGVWSLIAIEPGTCTVMAIQDGDENYQPASPVTRSITVLPGQTITVTGPLGNPAPPFTIATTGSIVLSVTADSGLPVTLTVLSTDECALNSAKTLYVDSQPKDFTVYGKAAGSCVIVATQDGGTVTDEEGSAPTTFGPAQEKVILVGVGATQIVTVKDFKSGATSLCAGVGCEINGAGSTQQVVVTSEVTSSTGTALTTQPVTHVSLTPEICVVLPPPIDPVSSEYKSEMSAGGVTTSTVAILAGAFGDCLIRGDQDGYNDSGALSVYAPTQSAVKTLTIKASGTQTQTLSFFQPAVGAGDPIAWEKEADKPFQGPQRTYGAFGERGNTNEFVVMLTSTNESATLTGLPITVTSANPSVCTVASVSHTETGSTASVVVVSGGTCTLTATQPGNATYQQAVQTGSFTVAPRQLAVPNLQATRQYNGTLDDLSFIGTLSGVIPGDGSAVALDLGGVEIAEASTVKPTAGTWNVEIDGATLTGAKAGSAYSLPAEIPATIVITKRPITLEALDVNLPQGTETPQTCSVSVTGNGLATYPNPDPEPEELTDTLTVTCEFRTSDNQPYSSSSPLDSGGTVLISAFTITHSNPAIGDVSSSYNAELNPGILNVTGSKVPSLVIEIEEGKELSDDDEITIIYGEDISELIVEKTKGKGSDNNPLTGQVVLKDGLNALDISSLPRGLHQPKVRFTPDDDSYSSVERTIKIKVQKRPVTFVVPEPERVYDGTTVVPLGNFGFEEAVPDIPRGVLARDLVGDEPLVLINSPTSVVVASADVGQYAFSLGAGPELDGASSDNYELEQPDSLPKARIVPRPLPVQIGIYTMMIGGPDTPNLQIVEKVPGPNEGVVAADIPGDTSVTGLQNVLGQGASVTIVDGSLSTVGSFYLNAVAPSLNLNYSLQVQQGRLHVASVTFDVSTNAELSPGQEVSCTCEGFAPGEVVRFEIQSTPTLLTSVVTENDGTCPETVGKVPDDFDAGSHSLVVTGAFPENSGVATRSIPVTVLGNVNGGVTPAPTGPTSPPPGRTTPTTQTPITPPASVLPPASPNVITPFLSLPGPPPGATNGLPPAQTTPPTGPQTGLQGPTGPNGQTNGPGVSPLQSVVQRSTETNNTFDLGVDNLSPSQVVGNGGSVKAGTRSVGQMREERLGGFDPGTALRVEVIGSRTTARFVISTLTGLDELVLIEQISRSSEGNRTDFAGVDRIGIGSPTGPQGSWSLNERDSAYDLFNYSRLDAPTKQSDLLGSNSYTWLNVEKGVRGYLPGSTIYLTATSSPVVFGEAQVGLDGEAIVNGDLAVELLGLGEHRIRVIGTRVFTDIQVDSDGEVIIPDFVLEQILLFDMGTDATVIVTGNNPTGGVHTVMRVVPLDPVSPWWTLWVIAWTALLLLLARLRGMIRTFMEKSVAGGAVLVSSIPALYLGWTTTVTQVAWWGLLMGLGLSVAVWLVPSLRRREEAVA